MIDKVFFTVFLLFLLLGSVTAGYGETIPTLAEIVRQVQEQYDKTTTMQASFRQTATNQLFNRTTTASGVLFLKKPGLIRWQYDKPKEQLLVVDGKQFWWYTPQKKQVVVKAYNQAYSSQLPLAFMMGEGKLSRDFYITFAEKQEVPACYMLDLLPTAANPTVKALHLQVDKKSFVISRVVIFDAYQNKTVMDLYNYRYNPKLDVALFTFIVPSGVRTITAADLAF